MPDDDEVEVSAEDLVLSYQNWITERIGVAQNLGVDLASRTIWITEGVEEELLKRFLPTMMILDQDPGPITIILHSGGGDMASGFAVYGLIRRAANEVTVIGTGQVSSMASVIFQAADVRILDESCRMMIHDVQIFSEGRQTGSEHIRNTQEIQELQRQIKQIYMDRSGQPQEVIDNMFLGETYLSAKEAVKLGLADKVLSYPKKSWKKLKPLKKR